MRRTPVAAIAVLAALLAAPAGAPAVGAGALVVAGLGGLALVRRWRRAE